MNIFIPILNSCLKYVKGTQRFDELRKEERKGNFKLSILTDFLRLL